MRSVQVDIIRCISCMMFFIFSVVICHSSDNAKIEDYFGQIEDSLSTKKKFDSVPGGMRIIGLSICSDGLKELMKKDMVDKKRIIALMDKIVRYSVSDGVCPYKNVLTTDFKEDGYNLYLTHLEIILLNDMIVTGNKKYKDLVDRIYKHFIVSINLSKNVHLVSYPGSGMKFPADQSATMYALWLYDTVNDTNNAMRLIDKWISYIEKNATYNGLRLPYSEITGAVWYSKYPRGCATPYLIYYMSRFKKEKAIFYWENFKSHFKGNLLTLTLFKEWSRIENGGYYESSLAKWNKKYGLNGDVDSGPVINDFGAAATGLSLLASKAAGDEKTYRDISGSIDICYNVAVGINKSFSESLNNFLSTSIKFTAEIL